MINSASMKVLATIKTAIEQDDVNILQSTPDWITKITNIGLPIFRYIGRVNAKNCLTLILAECPTLDPSVPWFYSETNNVDTRQLSTNCIFEAMKRGDAELTEIYMVHFDVSIEHFIRLLINGDVHDGHVNILQLLIDHHRDLDLNVTCTTNQFDGETALMITAQLNFPQLTQLLVDAAPRVDVDAVDALGNTALHYAAHFEHVECVQILLDGQALVTMENNQGHTAIEVTISEIIKLLISEPCFSTSIQPDVSDEFEDTTIFRDTFENALDTNSVDIMTEHPNWATQMTAMLSDHCGNAILCTLTLPRRHKMLDVILTHCGPFHVNAEQRTEETVLTPFQFAVMLGSAKAVRVLLKHAAARSIDLVRSTCYVRSVNNISWVCGPMMVAVERENVDVLQVLINHPDIDVNDGGQWRNSDSRWCSATPLLTAVGGPRQAPIPYSKRRAKFVEILLADSRIDVNIRDGQGHSALMYAVMLNDVELVGMLLTDNTDLSAKATNGKTAAQFATPKVKRMIRNFAAARRRRVEEETKENVRITPILNNTNAKRQTTKPQSSLTNLTTSNEIGVLKLKSSATPTSTTTTPSATVITKAPSTQPTICARNHSIDRTCQQCRSTTCAVNIVLQPCNHLAMCQHCVDVARGNKRFKCPMCKQRVMKYVRVCL